MEIIKETVKILNPWWDENKISEKLAKPYKRKAFKEILNLLKYRQIIILTGLRRVGKTTLLYQIIDHLLEKTHPKHILYFNFDKKTSEIIEVLNAYEDITHVNWKREKIFVFLDEIAKLEDWANKIKLLYDAFPNIKFFVSSSSSVMLEEEAIKTLGGRYFLKNIKPLSFVEFLELKKRGKLLKNLELYEREIKREVKKFLLRSFPEIIDWENELLIKDYLRSTIIDKVIKTDIPDKFENVSKDLLFNLVEIFFSDPGMYLDYDSISKKLRVSKKTLYRHIFYLEFSYLLRKVKNFRINTLTSSKKMQKVYPSWWTFAYCYTDNHDKIMENVIASCIDAKYYWRKNEREIDFLFMEDKKITPIEVKNKKELTKNDVKNMRYFLKKYGLTRGVVIYNGERRKEIINGTKIEYLPLWRWLAKSLNVF